MITQAGRLVRSARLRVGRSRRALRACPICDSDEVTPLHHQEFAILRGSPLPARYDVVACDKCSFVYADTAGDQRTYTQYYEELSKYEDSRVASGGGDNALDLDRLAATGAIIAGLLAQRGKSSRILDVGCANGGLLHAMRGLGFLELTGVDPSRECVEHVRNSGIAATRGTATDLSALNGSGTYDMGILSHVLEHVVDVKSAVLAVRDLLSDDGILYLEVPDASRYAQHPFVPFYYFDSEHINHFDAASLADLAAVTGQRIIACGERDLRVDDHRTYPAVWVALSPGQPEQVQLSHSGKLRECVTNYIMRSNVDARYPAVERLAATQAPILLWGAGSHAQRLLKDSPLARCRIVGIVDRDRVKQGRTLLGLTIGDPDPALTDLSPDVVIVIASVLHAKAITAEIRARNIRNALAIAG